MKREHLYGGRQRTDERKDVERERARYLRLPPEGKLCRVCYGLDRCKPCAACGAGAK